MKPDVLLLIQAVVSVLEIHKPVDVVLKTRVYNKTHRGLAGWCDTVFRNNRLQKHKIVINLGQTLESNFDVYGVIAHELIHAKMIEDNSFNENYHHDDRFQLIATHLEKILNDLGFSTGELYSPITDTD
jgi:hypothetical protein